MEPQAKTHHAVTAVVIEALALLSQNESLNSNHNNSLALATQFLVYQLGITTTCSAEVLAGKRPLPADERIKLLELSQYWMLFSSTHARFVALEAVQTWLTKPTTGSPIAEIRYSTNKLISKEAFLARLEEIQLERKRFMLRAEALFFNGSKAPTHEALIARIANKTGQLTRRTQAVLICESDFTCDEYAICRRNLEKLAAQFRDSAAHEMCKRVVAGAHYLRFPLSKLTRGEI